MTALFDEPRTKEAVISECGTYRYFLSRVIGSEPAVVAYFGVNPSTADASVDDATVRKWTGFSIRNGFGKFIVGNVFGFRATDVRLLAREVNPHGPDNYQHIDDIIAAANVLVPCWGNRDKVPLTLRPAFGRLMTRLKASGKPVKVFGYTKGGDPMHPLMLGYDTTLKDA